MSKEINFNNKYRVLLTEVLPYELPFRLNNDAFYENMQEGELRETFKEVMKNGLPHWTIPFNFYVRRSNSTKSRKLSLIHPYTQLQFVELYDTYADYMLYLCSNSTFSIRHISKKAQCIFKAEEKDDKDKQEIDELQHVEEIAENVELKYRSYFQYERYGLIYKFFTSGDYLRLEQKYSHMMKMDIASCFYHIYTHTISWAVKGKDQAKDNKSASTFENEFDTLMQHANYNETNGIVVGPEISRIFAEIILNKIDVTVLNVLRTTSSLEGKSLRIGVDYEIRRYVDDYFVYANSRDALDKILSVYKEQLEYYKLYINESKLEFSIRPFGSDLGDAKCAIRKMLHDFKCHYLEKEEGEYKRHSISEYKILSDFASEFRAIAHQYHLSYGELNKYTLKLLMYQVMQEIDSKAKPSLSLLLSYVEMSFYAFSLDMNVSASYKICRLIDYIVKWANCTGDIETIAEIENRINREAKRCMDIYNAQKREKDTNLEMLNLLLTLKQSTSFNISEMQLKKTFGIETNEEEQYKALNYFQICTLMFLVGNEPCYRNIGKNLKKTITKRLCNHEIFKYADSTMLFLDMMVCPYWDDKKKMARIKECLNISDSKKESWLRRFNKTTRWFFDWNAQHDISYFLDKKELHSPYE